MIDVHKLLWVNNVPAVQIVSNHQWWIKWSNIHHQKISFTAVFFQSTMNTTPCKSVWTPCNHHWILILFRLFLSWNMSEITSVVRIWIPVKNIFVFFHLICVREINVKFIISVTLSVCIQDDCSQLWFCFWNQRQVKWSSFAGKFHQFQPSIEFFLPLQEHFNSLFHIMNTIFHCFINFILCQFPVNVEWNTWFFDVVPHTSFKPFQPFVQV